MVTATMQPAAAIPQHAHPAHGAEVPHHSLLRVEGARTYPSGLVRVHGVLLSSDDAIGPAAHPVDVLTVNPVAPGRVPSPVQAVRTVDEARGRVRIDIVAHPDDRPAMGWLRALEPGSEVLLVEPPDTRTPPHLPGGTCVLLADSSAVPALVAVLGSWPDGAAGEVHVVVQRAEELAGLPLLPGVPMRARVGSPPAAMPLLDIARSIELTPGLTVWAAGERHEMRRLHGHFVGRGVDAGLVRVHSFWDRVAPGCPVEPGRRHRAPHWPASRIMDMLAGLSEVNANTR